MSDQPTEPKSHDAEGRFVFRLKTEAEKTHLGKVRPAKFLVDSVQQGELHFAFLIHLVTGILAGLYGGLSLVGIWPHEFAFLGQVILTFMKGAALGAILVGGALRWSPQGRTIKQRIKKDTATSLDHKARVLAQMSFAFGCYVFIGVTFFEYFPVLWEWKPVSLPLRLGRHLATTLKQEKLWNQYERWATAPAAGAQILRPTWLIPA
ncbi:hypothetical protein V8E36_000555 [Tilletia maclaganii]